ncbi:UNVERIFIED_CONTAM: hypothetical protein FKN15_057600 [Acipenser sinensis]
MLLPEPDLLLPELTVPEPELPALEQEFLPSVQELWVPEGEALLFPKPGDVLLSSVANREAPSSLEHREKKPSSTEKGEEVKLEEALCNCTI